MSSYFSIGRLPGFHGNSVYFPADETILEESEVSSEMDHGKRSEMQKTHKQMSKFLSRGAAGDIPNALPRLGGLEYVNPRGSSPLGAGFQNFMQTNAHTPFSGGPAANAYGAYSSVEHENVFNRDSDAFHSNKTTTVFNRANDALHSNKTTTVNQSREGPVSGFSSWSESKWSMPTKIFSDSYYALGTLNAVDVADVERGHAKHQEEMMSLQKDADSLRMLEEEESLTTAVNKLSTAQDIDNSLTTATHQGTTPQKHVQIAAADAIGHDEGRAMSDSIYISLPNMHNAYTRNYPQQPVYQPIIQRETAEQNVTNSNETEGSEPVKSVAMNAPIDQVSEIKTAIEDQPPKVFEDSFYAFDTESGDDKSDTGSENPELVDAQVDDDNEDNPSATTTDSVKPTDQVIGLPKAKITCIPSDYNLEELRGLESFGSR
ncbi:unnamed protein product [Anisakis simplex]|uniref:Uncharacterized protein n=1 Tax=Anisakis simplex TaxID=6269 RepID=A0A0M3K7U9_ANISI|nr:unnamed protein product [Anisakis simplex]